jgi:TolA-binding protein
MKMNEKKLENLLKQADSDMELPSIDAEQLSLTVRRRLQRRKQTFHYGMLAAAAVITVVCVLTVPKYQLYRKERRIAQLEQEIKELALRTESTLAKVEEMLARQQQHQAELRLASYRDPIRQQVEEAAFILIYQADRMMKKYNQKEEAIQYYNQVIEYFGDTPSAETARELLMQIQQKNQPNHI